MTDLIHTYTCKGCRETHQVQASTLPPADAEKPYVIAECTADDCGWWCILSRDGGVMEQLNPNEWRRGSSQGRGPMLAAAIGLGALFLGLLVATILGIVEFIR